MDKSINPVMVSKIDKLGKALKGLVIISEFQFRESDKVGFYHTSIRTDKGFTYVLGVNYLDLCIFLNSDKISLNDIVDLIRVKKQYLMLKNNENIKVLNI